MFVSYAWSGGFGKTMDALKEHFKGKLTLGNRDFDWIWWRSASRMGEFHPDQLIDCLFVPEVNVYNGRTTLQLVIKDARPSE